MQLLTIIPARGGSKRVPGKNIKSLAGIPLIAHTIRAAQGAGCSQEIIVSTDDKDIAKVALDYEAHVPYLRDAKLASDSSDVIDTVIDIIEYFSNRNQFFDSILLLQPTSPFRTQATIRQAVALHQTTGQSVVTVSPASIKPSWFRRIDKNGNMLLPKEMEQNVTDKSIEQPLYELNGNIYLATVEQILANRSLYSDPTKAYIIENPIESLDIDTPLDWSLAEKIVDTEKGILS